ncbi:MAG TPA: glutamate-5-semialdehyde dehydrogenase [Solirubrobacteraceae bacterium]|jgi:glutamate-5-semialdehyde dehydrogenase|nr:glutamate-5-semialdehyde dehydrogenase [Solirubrobacteraceae bacterium]
MALVTESVEAVCAQARRAARKMASLETVVKDAALEAIAQALDGNRDAILEANAADLADARDAGLSDALLDRLRLDERRLAAMAAGAREIAVLTDPVGELLEEQVRPNGLRIKKLRVPLGVVAVIYEARPNVTIDAAALCLKSGNAIVLRGSSSAGRSNAILAAVAAAAAEAAGVPEGAISILSSGRREELAELARQDRYVDLIIPRGGEGLKAALLEHATVPVIYAASGNCHVYVDAAADLERAQAIVLNAKVQRPGVCNAAETLLVHAAVADAFLPAALQALGEAGVELRVDERAAALAGPVPVVAALAEDWDTEYLALTLAVGVVDSLDAAIEHIAAHGTGHSEAIVTSDRDSARRFESDVDAACIYVNASTRFTDGGEFGMGAEIGNSTQKLHARGPIGLRELCAAKYLVEGDGHVRS